MSAAALLDVAYVLKRDEAHRRDASLLAAYIARGVEDVQAVDEDLAAAGAVASFERALNEVDLPDLPVPDEETAEATIISMQAFVDQVNASMSDG